MIDVALEGGFVVQFIFHLIAVLRSWGSIGGEIRVLRVRLVGRRAQSDRDVREDNVATRISSYFWTRQANGPMGQRNKVKSSRRNRLRNSLRRPAIT